jgi:hypothetical protein
MAQVNATFNIQEFELRNYTNPYLSPTQSVAVFDVETRVNEQLDFLAQMLGWNGSNYWFNLVETPDQKRQLLGGTFGVYNSYVIPKIYEVRNWDNKLVVDRLQFLEPGRQTQVARISLGDDTYQLRSVEVEGDKYVISIGPLTDTFFEQIANNAPLQVDIPTYRPAPFYRPSVGISGDYSFICGQSGGDLVLYPAYDTQKNFPFQSLALFSDSVYYFDRPVFLSSEDDLTPEILPEYDQERGLWYLRMPGSIGNSTNITSYLVWQNSSSTLLSHVRAEVLIQPWSDPSDWNSENVLNNFRGVWGNKGGDLPFNFVFDALSIHGFNEKTAITLPPVERSLALNDIVNYIYAQKTVISPLAPGGAKIGDLWWNDLTGALAVWIPDTTGCAAWVEIDYRNSPQRPPASQVTYPDVTAFRAAASGLPDGAIVRIDNAIGLTTSDNVIGLKGLLKGSAAVVMTKVGGGVYWAPDKFHYATVTEFGFDAGLLPFKVPVRIYNAGGLAPDNGAYRVSNLSFTISGDYEIVLQQFYTEGNWELSPDSLLKYIANTALFGDLLQGEMWWDYVNSDPETRAAGIFYTSPHPIAAISVEFPGEDLDDGAYTGVDLVNLSGTGGKAQVDITVVGNAVTSVALTPGQAGDLYAEGDLLIPDSTQYPGLVGAIFKVDATTGERWIAVNRNPQFGAPGTSLDLSVIRFYCDGHPLAAGTEYTTEDYSIIYVETPAEGTYDFTYSPRTFTGEVSLPEITISDAITSAYRSSVTDLVFSGLTYKMSPSVYNAETPLRLWKSQALQVVETLDHLAEDNYINPLLADLNTGPGPENWEKYFVRLPLEYGRNEPVWQKIALVCQDFAYWGSSVEPERMRCPPEDDLPAIYEELFLYDQPVPDYTYVYCEPYLYSNIAYFNYPEDGPYRNAGIYPASDVQFDEFFEAELVDYDALHNRQADVTSSPGGGYGDWKGEYVNINPCVPLTGFFTTDLVNGGIDPVAAPVWDASIYKFAPTCESDPASYSVDANHYKIGYCYFVADASAAEDAFFDITQEAAWRYPVTQPKTSYLTPR